MIPSGATSFILELHIVDDCNLACSYCYLGYGYKQTARESNGLMTIYQLDKLLDELRLSEWPGEKLTVSFWGGEPLLNFELIKHAVIKIRKVAAHVKRKELLIVTNGTLIDEEIALSCIRNEVKPVITIDGSKSIHDANRVYISGAGSYERVINGINILNSCKTPYSVRATLTKNSPSATQLINDLKQSDIPGIYFSVMTPPPNTVGTDHDSLDIHNFACELVELFKADFHSGSPFIYRNIQLAICALFSSTPKYSCGINTNKIAVKHDGTIYPCHRMVISDDQCIGHIGNIDHSKNKSFYVASSATNKKCATCSLKHVFCGGFCRHECFIRQDPFYLQDDWCVFNKIILEKTYTFLSKLYFEEHDSYYRLINSHIPNASQNVSIIEMKGDSNENYC